MESDNPLKEGYILIPSQGVFGHLKKSWQRKYCKLYHASKYGIERLECFDSEEDANSNTSCRFITLENCVKITPDPQKIQFNVFVVITKTSTYHFATAEENEMTEWLSAFQSVAFKEGSNAPRIEEDNDLYCPSGEGVFLVKLVSSEVSVRCGLEPGPYTLLLTSSAIQLRDSKEPQILYTWPYLFIRKYGYRDRKFTFEAGRKCQTGEGEFQLEHSNPQEIYRCISLKMKSMRNLIGGQMNSTSSIFCADTSNQFQAALSMEARSRSPLPPSPNSTTNILEMDLNNSSQFKSVDCITNLSGSGGAPPPLKPKATSYNNLFHASHEVPPIPCKPKPIISPTSETSPPLSVWKSGTLSLDKINSRKSPNLFRAVVDININDGPDFQSNSQSVAPPLKPKPLKPPRKAPFVPANTQKCANDDETSLMNNNNNNNSTGSKRYFRQKSEPTNTAKPKMLTQSSLPNLPSDQPNPVPPYDEVEIRQDAWKTLGMDEMTHTERPFSQLIDPSDSSPDYEVLEKSPEDSGKLTPNGALPKMLKPKFLPIKPVSVLGNYDTLQHFGNVTKMNGKSSGYKQVVINHSNSNSPSTPDGGGYSFLESYANNQNLTFHDYDEVDETMEPVRPADDSHSGYGMIRKKSDSQSQSDLRFPPPKHKVYNKMEYAVITKSKQV